MEEIQEKKSMRDGFGEALLELAREDERIVVLTADLADSTRVSSFAKEFPERFFEVGVAEQSLVTVAAGMAAAGKIPFVTSYAVFSPGRNWEQIKVAVAMNNLPVKIIGAHAGFGASMYGATHQSFEDIAMMRTIPNMTVVVPADYNESKEATKAIANNELPTYLRLSRQESDVLPKSNFEIGKANILRDGVDPQVAIIGCGVVVTEAMKAAKELEIIGIETMVINNHTIKPIDDIAITNAARICGGIVTVEEHQLFGGLGSAVSEVVVQGHVVPMEFVGMRDSFSESAKTPKELFNKFKINKDEIVASVKKVILRKNS